MIAGPQKPGHHRSIEETKAAIQSPDLDNLELDSILE